MQTGHHRSSGVGAPIRTDPVGSNAVLGGRWFDPFLDAFPEIAGTQKAGLVARGDGHTIGEGKQSCPTRDGSNPTRNGALPS